MQYIKYYLCPQLLDVRDGDGVWPQLIHKVSKRALISNETRLWPNGIVYYKIDAQFTGIHEYSTYIYIQKATCNGLTYNISAFCALIISFNRE